MLQPLIVSFSFLPSRTQFVLLLPPIPRFGFFVVPKVFPCYLWRSFVFYLVSFFLAVTIAATAHGWWPLPQPPPPPPRAMKMSSEIILVTQKI